MITAHTENSRAFAPSPKDCPSHGSDQLQGKGHADLYPSLICPGTLQCHVPMGVSRNSSKKGKAHLGLMPGTFSVLEAPALLLKESLSTLLPLRDGAESEIV